MNKNFRRVLTMLATFLALGLGLMLPGQAAAHCDSLDGPVVGDARIALEKGDVTPVLKWVGPEDEKEIRAAFSSTLAVRKLNSEAKNLADMYFFEKLVRIHRAGEGAPYTGLKAAGTVEPVVAKADKALEQGNADGLVKAILTHTDAGIRERFNHALETKKHAGESIELGRKYVEAYVTYVHYVEEIAQVVHSASQHGEAPQDTPHKH